jgi:hypothetical protein
VVAVHGYTTAIFEKLDIQSRNSAHIWNQRLNSCTHKRLSVLSILAQANPVPTFPSYFFKVHLSSHELLGLPSSLLPEEIPMFLVPV